MRTPLLILTVAMYALVACGSGGDVDPDAGAQLDAQLDAPAGPCDPVAQSGCGADEKCTWVNLTINLGTLACVPDGDRGLGATCTHGPAGEDTGFDDCVAGTACAGTCRPVCSRVDDACGSSSRCEPDADFGTEPFGVCQQLCEPLTQETVDGEAACGSADVGSPARGCYGYFDQEFVCRAVPSAIQAAPTSYDHGDAPLFEGVINGCAPGFGAFVSTDGVGFPDRCVAMCRPGPTSSEDASNANGLVGSGDTCADHGASGADECRYFWYLEVASVPAATPLHTDDLGFCWAPEDFGASRCATIATADQAGAGCAPYTP